jgi:adenine deaminase
VALDEAIEKIDAGCRIAIREGSAVRNFDALSPLLDRYPDACMFCSDDKHPDDLLAGHINQLAARAVAKGHDLMSVLRAGSLNAVQHYGLNVGLLRKGDPADLAIVSNLQDFRVLETRIDGRPVAKDGKCLIRETVPEKINNFHAAAVAVADLLVPAQSSRIRIIEALDGQLVTTKKIGEAPIEGEFAVADPGRDLLKLVVLNRYRPGVEPAIAFVSGFGLRHGAIASSVAHDSHNIVAVGTNDHDLCQAINAVVTEQGGLSAAHGDTCEILPLPVAGLMTTGSCQFTARKYSVLNDHAATWGSVLRAPYMTLSFMALLVIPALKLSDRGLFDVDRFEFVPLFVPDRQAD